MLIKFHRYLSIGLLLSGCHTSIHSPQLIWEERYDLPAIDGQAHPGLAGAMSGILSSKLVIAGGANFPIAPPWENGKKVFHDQVYIYDIQKDSINKLKQHHIANLPSYSANISLDTAIISAGGERKNGAIRSVFAYHWDKQHDQLTQSKLADLPVALTAGSLAQVDRDLYFIGGENGQLVSDKIYRLDGDAPEDGWQEFLTLPHALSHAVALSDQQGHLFILGGRCRHADAPSTIYKQAFRVNVRTQNIQSLPDLPHPLAAGTGVYVNGSLWMFGGDDGKTFNRIEQLMIDIDACTDPGEKQELIEEKNTLQATHTGFQKSCWVLALPAGQWQQTTPFPEPAPVTTTALQWGERILIPSGEVRPGVRTRHIFTGRIQ